MIAGKEIERIVMVNKEYAEIYLKKEVVESEKYSDIQKPNNGRMGFGVPKPHYTHNIGDLATFEEFLQTEQKNAGYSDKEIIYLKPRHVQTISVRYSAGHCPSC
jgi:cell division protease FtsH